MGQELECRMLYRKQSFAGKAYLETDHILFRGAERVKIALKDLTAVSAQGGVLALEFEGGPARLQLGPAAEKWAQRILHPPTRASKLGVKPGLEVRLEGEFEADFLDELRETKEAKGKADLIFLLAPVGTTLRRIPRLMEAMKPAGALWVVYPKGVAAIREVEVIERGRQAGLKDVKVASFSATHTALKFVIPVAAR
jgi:hypothetical protein